jgi:hypothetical protein
LTKIPLATVSALDKRQMKRTSIIFATFLLIACQKPGAPTEGPAAISANLGTEFSLKAGETTTFEDQELTIKLNSVTNESRCPVGLRCVWSGNAQVNLLVTKAGQPSKKLRLNTLGGPKFPIEGKFLDYTITLTGLTPHPVNNNRIAQSNYAATLVVSK